MPIEYRITSYNTNYLRELGKDNWILSTIHEGKMFFYREVPKERKARVILTGDDFDDFYKLYPNKKAKKDAQTMWSRLDEKSKTLAIEGLKRYIVYWNKKGIEKQNLPHPATWINGKRWEDDLSDSVTPINTLQVERAKKEIEDDKKIEEERLWNEQALARLKASGKWEEYYNKALEETPEGQRGYERIIIARIISRLRTNL